MPLTETEKTRAKARKEQVEALHHHHFIGTGTNCAECGLLPADFFHNYVDPSGVVVPISETEGLRFQARNTENVTLYKHAFDLCESTGNCRECQLPLADALHDPVRGSATIIRNVDQNL